MVNMRYFFFFLILFWCLPFFSQHNHSGGHDEENEDALLKHTPQHGGDIVEVGKYKFEVVVNPMQIEEKLTVYILKKSYKQLEFKNGIGTLVCRYKDGKIDTLKLNSQKDRFTTNEIDPTKMMNMIFKFTLDKKEVSGVYFYKGITKN